MAVGNATLSVGGILTASGGMCSEQTEASYQPYDDDYDAGQVRAFIEEDLLPDDEEKGREDSGQAEFRYDHKGGVKEAVYQRSSWTQGTTDSSGMIEYDEQGRMIYNSYYITHGGHKDLFVYEEGAARPWARLRWCSFAPGFPDVTLFLKSK